MMDRAITLQQLNRRVAKALSEPFLQSVWVVAELSDVRVNHGHCYMELLEKNPDTGAVDARMRGVIWASTFMRVNADFHAATGQSLRSGLKVMVCGSVSYHSAYGMSFVVSAIDPSYTMGESERRRREIIARLKAEGMLELNKSLEWPVVPQRVAVISAPGAAGYGDFRHQLCLNPSRLRFSVKLFPAVMQGDRTVPSVISALEEIAAEVDDWDCVVIIRGGGATSELQAFDHYDLAANVAQFPLPVIIGIGHERDVTVLDYVANMRVKTPTAAAEWLVARGDEALESLRRVAADILQSATDRISGCKTQLAYMESTLGIAPEAAVDRARAAMQQAVVTLAGTGARRISPQLSRLDHVMESVALAGRTATARERERLAAREQLIATLSPQATLRRGYSITTYHGRSVRSAADLPEGAEMVTLLADGEVTSTVVKHSTHKNQ